MKLQKSIFKIFILSLAITILAPIIANAIPSITNEEEKITLGIDEFRGKDSDGTYTAYGFAGGQHIYKIYEEKNGILDHNKEIYCLDISRGFNLGGSINSNTHEYNQKIDMLSQNMEDNDIIDKEKANNRESFSEDDYIKIVRILRNIYVQGSGDEAKKNFLKKMIDTESLQYVDEHDNEQIYITDKDIEVAQQLAIWHYTNENKQTKGRKLSDYLGKDNLTDIYQAIYSDVKNKTEDEIIQSVQKYMDNGSGPDEDLSNGRRRL